MQLLQSNTELSIAAFACAATWIAKGGQGREEATALRPAIKGQRGSPRWHAAAPRFIVPSALAALRSGDGLPSGAFFKPRRPPHERNKR